MCCEDHIAFYLRRFLHSYDALQKWRLQCEYWSSSYIGKVALVVNDSGAGSASAIVPMGQVAVHVAEKLLQLGAIPLTFSDSSGHIYEPEVSKGRLRIAFLLMFWSAQQWKRGCFAGFYGVTFLVTPLCVRYHRQIFDAKRNRINCTNLGCDVFVEETILYSKLLGITAGRHNSVMLACWVRQYRSLSYYCTVPQQENVVGSRLNDSKRNPKWAVFKCPFMRSAPEICRFGCAVF